MKLRTRKRKAFTRQTYEFARRAFLRTAMDAIDKACAQMLLAAKYSPQPQWSSGGGMVATWKPRPYVFDPDVEDARAYFRRKMAEAGIKGTA